MPLTLLVHDMLREIEPGVARDTVAVISSLDAEGVELSGDGSCTFTFGTVVRSSGVSMGWRRRRCRDASPMDGDLAVAPEAGVFGVLSPDIARHRA